MKKMLLGLLLLAVQLQATSPSFLLQLKNGQKLNVLVDQAALFMNDGWRSHRIETANLVDLHVDGAITVKSREGSSADYAFIEDAFLEVQLAEGMNKQIPWEEVVRLTRNRGATSLASATGAVLHPKKQEERIAALETALEEAEKKSHLMEREVTDRVPSLLRRLHAQDRRVERACYQTVELFSSYEALSALHSPRKGELPFALDLLTYYHQPAPVVAVSESVVPALLATKCETLTYTLQKQRQKQMATEGKLAHLQQRFQESLETLAEVEDKVSTSLAENRRLLESYRALSNKKQVVERELAQAQKKLEEQDLLVARLSHALEGQRNSLSSMMNELGKKERTLPPETRTHRVVAGESLTTISEQYYGTAWRWEEIYKANRDQIASDYLLKEGMELRIP